MSKYICEKQQGIFGSAKYVPLKQFVCCAECRHWRKLMLNNDGEGVCYGSRLKRQLITPHDWYCADGVKK